MRIQSAPFIVVLAVAACGEATVAPAPDTGAPPAPSASVGATVDHGEGVFTIVNDLVYMECVGEDVLFNGEVPYRWTSTTTPSGRTTFQWAFIPHSQTGSAVGQATGRVWTPELAISPEVDHFTGTTTSGTFTARQKWVNAGGPTMLLHTLWHVSQNARGETTVDRFVFSCNAI